MKDKFFNIIDYILMRGDLSFDENPFNSVDALILSQISYNNIDGLVSEDLTEKLTLAALAEKFSSLKDYKARCNMGAMINPLTPTLLDVAAKSERFGHINVSGFINKIDEEKIEQFCAITYEIQKERYVIALRGTDDTIAGWYEDFNLGYMDVIPAQADTAEYVRNAMRVLKGSYIITGHSKGGNLSVKGGMSVEKKNLKRLEAVYNFDGPGFFAPVYETPEFLQIKDKVKAFFPEFCVVGMMFEHTSPFTIVSCAADLILQHDPFSWKVQGSEFVTAQALADDSKIFYASFNDWAARLSADERKKFIDTFFDVIYASGVKTNYEIEQNKLICGGKMISRLSELNEEERKAFQRAIKIMIKVAKDNIPMFSVFDLKLDLKEQIKKLRR
ncbi:MAG: DUF2974 domain-containing protein [Treponema sp.]|nr:DUF2974 domain-containing protein [Treponema sp.]